MLEKHLCSPRIHVPNHIGLHCGSHSSSLTACCMPKLSYSHYLISLTCFSNTSNSPNLEKPYLVGLFFDHIFCVFFLCLLNKCRESNGTLRQSNNRHTSGIPKHTSGINSGLKQDPSVSNHDSICYSILTMVTQRVV
jgi:hypothetical protein